MHIFRRGAALLFCLFLLCGLGACKRGGGARAGESFLPEDAVAVVAVPRLGEALRAFGAVEGKFSDLEPVRRAMTRAREQLLQDAELDLAQPANLSKLGLDLDGGLYYALSATGKDHALILGVRDGKVFDAYVRRMAQKKSEATFEDRNVNGVTVTVLSRFGRARLAWTLVRGQVILCPQAAGDQIAEHAARLAKLERHLGQSAAFQRAKERLGTAHLLAFGDLSRGGKLLQAAMPDLKAVMERSNLGEYSTAAFGLRLSAEEVVMRFFGEHSAEVGKLMAAGSTGIGKAAPLATYLPPETMAVTRFSMNPAVFSQQVQKGLQPEQKQAYDQAVQKVEQTLQMSVEKDLLPLLAGRFLIALLKPATADLPKTMRAAELFGALPMVGMIQVTDSKKAQALLTTVERLLQQQGAPVTQRSEGNNLIYALTKGPKPLVSWTVAGDVLVVATGEQLSKTLAFMAAKKGPTLVDRVAQPRAKEALGSPDRSIFFMDMEVLTAMVRDLNAANPVGFLDGAIMALSKFRDLTVSGELSAQSALSEMSVRLK